MKTKRCLYGLMGLLSLLGLIGVFTEAKSFLAFFAFAVDFFVGGRGETEALTAGLAFGWAVSAAVYALSTAYYGFKEKWGLEHDKE